MENKEISAGILFIYNNKLLLAHPTGRSFYSSYGYPKGRLDKGENPLEAAIRETEEEIGIKVSRNMLSRAPHELNYSFNKKKKKVNKTSYYFICKINKLSDIGLDTEVVPKSQLQLDEIDWAGFVNYEDAKKRLGKSFLPLLKHYNANENVQYIIETYESFIKNKNTNETISNF